MNMLCDVIDKAVGGHLYIQHGNIFVGRRIVEVSPSVYGRIIFSLEKCSNGCTHCSEPEFLSDLSLVGKTQIHDSGGEVVFAIPDIGNARIVKRKIAKECA